jgi:hypothetical protein
MQDSPTSPRRMARIVFRDTLVQAFRQGMKKEKERKEVINKKWN